MIIRAQNIAVAIEEIAAVEREDWDNSKSIYIFTRGISAPRLGLNYATVEERDEVYEYIISLMSGVINIDKLRLEHQDTKGG